MGTRIQPSVLRKNSSSGLTRCEDEVLREVYAVRDAFAAEHKHDLARIYADLKRTEARSSLKRIAESPRRKSRRTA